MRVGGTPTVAGRKRLRAERNLRNRGGASGSELSGLEFRHHNGAAGFAADTGGERSSLLAGHAAADDHAPEWRRTSIRGRDAGFGKEIRKNGAQGFGTGRIREGSGLHGEAGSSRGGSGR